MCKENKFFINEIPVWRYTMPALLSNMYIILEGTQALVVDPSTNPDALRKLQDAQPEKVTVLLTHEHFDHISGVNLLRENFAVEVVCLKACAERLEDPVQNLARFWRTMIMDKPPQVQEEGRKVEDLNYACTADTVYEAETTISWAGHTVRMIPAPGHSKGGCLLLLDGKFLFSGDNLVEGAGVICRFPGGSKRDYAAITRPRLEALPDDTFVFPGHGEPGPLGGLRRYMALFDARTDRRRPEKSV